eukprot:139805_1
MLLTGLVFIVLGIIGRGYYVNDNILFICGFICCLILFLALISIIEWDRSSPYRIPRSIKSNIDPPKIDDDEKTDNKHIIYNQKFIDTSYGDTYIEQWQILNRSKDIKSYHMICIHGFSWPQGLTTALIPYIINLCKDDEKIAISSITSYHIYGRGYSDTTLTPNNLPLFLCQISDIITSLNITGPIILVGYSMGGMIAISFTQKYPNRVHKLICIAPAGFRTNDIPFKMKFMINIIRIPLIGEFISGFIINSKTVKTQIKDGINCKVYGDHTQNVIDKMSKFSYLMIENNLKGYLYSLLSTLRYMPFFADFEIIYQSLYKDDRFNNKKQWLFIWGMKDKTALCKQDEVLSDTQIIKINDAKHADIVQHYCIQQYADKLTQFINN